MTCRYYLILFIFFLTVTINKIAAQDTIIVNPKTITVTRESEGGNMIRQKIDSRLLQAISEMKQKNKSGKPGSEPVRVNADKNGNLQVDIKAAVSGALTSKIMNLGGTIIFASEKYNSVRAEINLSVIEKIAAFPETKFIEPAAMAQLNRVDNPLRIPPVPVKDTLH